MFGPRLPDKRGLQMSQRQLRHRLTISAIGLLLASTAFPAFAQQGSDAAVPAADTQANDKVEDIIVTASKRGDESIRNVPITVQALTGDTLVKSGITQFSEYATRVPGLAFQDLGPGDKKYVLRGINSTGAATVGSYYDEAVISANNANDGGGRNVDIKLYDIQRIEVLKGPQGTLYGASSESGTIRVITNKPDTHEFGGYVAGEISGTHKGGANYHVNGAVNLPIVEDKLALRVVGWFDDDSGFIDQPRIPSGRLNNVNTDNTSGGRALLRYTPTDNFSLTASATYQKQHSDGSSRYTPKGTQSFSTTGFPPIPGGDLINTDLTRSPYDDTAQIYGATAEYNFSSGSIVATSNYFDRDIRFVFDSSPILFFFGVPIPGITIQPQKRTIWSNELRYASKFDGPFNFVAGGFYSEETSNFRTEVIRSNNLGEPAGAFSPLDSDDALSSPTGNTFFGRFENQKLKQYAFFGEATFALTNTLKATGGIRYFHNDALSVDQQTHPFGGFGSSPPFTPQTNVAVDQKVTYKGNVSWKPSSGILIYGTVASGFRTGGTNQADLPFASGIPRTYGADSLTNFEVGTKLTLLGGKLTIDAAAYHIDWSNIQIRALDATQAFPFTTNAGTAAVDGVEADVNIALARGISVDIGGSYQYARLTQNQPGDIVADPTLGRDGDNIPNVPRFNSNISLDVNRPLTGRFNYLVHIDTNYRGSSHTTLGRSRNPFDTTLDNYSLTNVRLGVENGPWKVEGFVRNLFDARAQIDSISSSQDPLAYITVRPRTIGIAASRKF